MILRAIRKRLKVRRLAENPGFLARLSISQAFRPYSRKLNRQAHFQTKVVGNDLLILAIEDDATGLDWNLLVDEDIIKTLVLTLALPTVNRFADRDTRILSLSQLVGIQQALFQDGLVGLGITDSIGIEVPHKNLDPSEIRMTNQSLKIINLIFGLAGW